jgi:glycolate oxidase iron-sulfur subunit
LEFDGDSKTLLYTGNMYQLMAYNDTLSRLEGVMGDRLSGMVASMAASHPSVLYFTRFAANRRIKRRMNSYLRSIYTLLRSSGLRFNYLREDEPYPGTLMYDLGYVEEFARYGAEVADLFKDRGVETIVTVDPHTFDLLQNKYPRLLPNFDFKVVHYLDLLKGMDFEKEDEAVTFHEPCYFALRGEPYATPQSLLSKTARVELPQRSGKRTMCCGGPDEALYSGLSRRIAEERTSQLRAVGKNRVITACPICYANLEGDVEVEDIAGYLAGRMKVGGS